MLEYFCKIYHQVSIMDEFENKPISDGDQTSVSDENLQGSRSHDNGETSSYSGEGDFSNSSDENQNENHFDKPDFEGVSPDARAMYFENSQKRQRDAEQVIEREWTNSVKNTLAFSLWGLILSLFIGLGLPFSIVGLVKAKFSLKKRNSQTLNWAKNIGLVGLILNATFIFVFFIILVVSRANAPTPLEPVAPDSAAEIVRVLSI